MRERTIVSKLIELGLTERQAKVYMVLARSGDMRIHTIVNATELPRSTIYEDIAALRKKGLIEEIVDEKHKEIRAFPLNTLKQNMHEKISAIEHNLSTIDDIESAVEKLSIIGSEPAVAVRYYKGRSGARQLLWNSLKATQEVYVYSEWGRGEYVGVEFYRRFVAESKRRNLKEKVITLNNERVLRSITKHIGSPIARTHLADIHCVDPEEIAIKGETFIYDNVYAQIFLKDKTISGFEIESTKFVAMQRSMFESYWRATKPINELIG